MDTDLDSFTRSVREVETTLNGEGECSGRELLVNSGTHFRRANGDIGGTLTISC